MMGRHLPQLSPPTPSPASASAVRPFSGLTERIRNHESTGDPGTRIDPPVSSMAAPTKAPRTTTPPATSAGGPLTGPIRETRPSRFVHATGELAAALGRWTGTTAAF